MTAPGPGSAPRGDSLVVGVAGGYCAGKDTVVWALEEQGLPSIDVDAVGHRVLGELASRIVEIFGSRVAGPGGAIDRKELGNVVFRNPDALSRLEAVVHPRMREVVAAEVERLGRKCVINAAILYKMGLHELCDVVLCVRAPLLARVRRARLRDGVSAGAAFRRIWAQRRICLKPKGAQVDTLTVRNAGSVEALKRAVRALSVRRADS